MMSWATSFARDLFHGRKGNISRSLGIQTKAIPGGEPIGGNLARNDRRFEKCEGLGDPLSEFLPGDFIELRFRVVQVKDVDTLNTQVGPTALELIGQIARQKAMAAGHDVFRTKNSALEKFARKIGFRVVRH